MGTSLLGPLPLRRRRGFSTRSLRSASGDGGLLTAVPRDVSAGFARMLDPGDLLSRQGQGPLQSSPDRPHQ